MAQKRNAAIITKQKLMRDRVKFREPTMGRELIMLQAAVRKGLKMIAEISERTGTASPIKARIRATMIPKWSSRKKKNLFSSKR